MAAGGVRKAAMQAAGDAPEGRCLLRRARRRKTLRLMRLCKLDSAFGDMAPALCCQEIEGALRVQLFLFRET